MPSPPANSNPAVVLIPYRSSVDKAGPTLRKVTLPLVLSPAIAGPGSPTAPSAPVATVIVTSPPVLKVKAAKLAVWNAGSVITPPLPREMPVEAFKLTWPGPTAVVAEETSIFALMVIFPDMEFKRTELEEVRSEPKTISPEPVVLNEIVPVPASMVPPDNLIAPPLLTMVTTPSWVVILPP